MVNNLIQIQLYLAYWLQQVQSHSQEDQSHPFRKEFETGLDLELFGLNLKILPMQLHQIHPKN